MPETTKNNLIDHLLSAEYITLLERAILARYSTSTNNKEQHLKSINLIKTFKLERNI